MRNRKEAARCNDGNNIRNYYHTLLAASIMVYSGINLAHGEGSISEVASPPAFTALRYDEDYSYLKDPAARTNLFDSLKYIPLNKQGDTYLTLGGQIRDRYEYFNNYTFGKGPQTATGYNLLRTLLNADMHIGPDLRIFVQGISVTEQGRAGGPRPSDEDEIDLHQAFADLMLPITTDTGFTLRGGRQVMVFGAQRLIDVSDFTNVRRTFGGIRGTLNMPGNTLDVFYARPVNGLPYEFDDDVPATFLAGVYDTWNIPGELEKAKTKLETYALYVDRQSITFNKTTAGERRYTFGTRFTTNPKPADFDLEADYQIGRFDGEDTHAFSIAAIGGYTLEQTLFMPRAFLGFDIASGGSHNNPGDAFDQLFPSGHDQFGTIDAIGRQNIIDVHPGLTLDLLENIPGAKQLTLLAQYRQFWRESDQDAVYTASRGILRASANGGKQRQRDWRRN